MISSHELLLFAGAALLMVLTPGPNMIYLLSRSLAQGRMAGVIVLSAGAIASWFARNRRWIAAQRHFTGLVLAGLAVRLVLDPRAR